MRESTSAASIWAERVRAWQASGETAASFARGRGFAAGTLRYWSSRLERDASPRFVQLVTKPTAAGASSTSPLVVEVGAARIRVTTGFDAVLLVDVVRALGGAER